MEESEGKRSERRLELASVVIPLFNESEVLPELLERLEALAAQETGYAWEFLLVDDGSRDDTPRLLREAAQRNPIFRPVFFSRNFGHQPAVTAGQDFATGDVVAVIDGDLQDPPEMIPEMISRWSDGADVVYAVRENRKESLLKRASYKLFYRLLRWSSKVEIHLDSGDCCLMDRKVVDVLKRLPDRSRFLRGLRAWVGFRQEPFRYDRSAREKGEPKYTYRQLMALAVDGFVSFSELPLRLGMWVGMAMVSASVLYAAIAALLTVVSWENRPAGFATLVVVMTLLSGIQLLVMSLIGEYIIRIFKETKGRPIYIVAETANLPAHARADLGVDASALGRGTSGPE